MMLQRCVILVVAAGLLGGLVACEKKDEETDEEKQQKQAEAEAAEEEEEEPEAPDPDPSEPATVGLMTVDSDRNVEDVANKLQKTLEKGDAVSIVKRVDHAKDADEAGEELSATTLLMFTNPKIEAPFVERSVTAALDLPQKVLIWEDDGQTRVGFNAPAYVAKRHGIDKLDLFIGRLETGTNDVIEKAADTSVDEIPRRNDIGIEAGTGIATQESNNEVSQTADLLAKHVEEADDTKLVARLDWADHARKAGSEIRPARIVWYSHPAQDAKIMQDERIAGIDLPRPMFVYEDKRGAIMVAYNDPKYLEMRYGLELDDELSESIADGLKELVEKATTEKRGKK